MQRRTPNMQILESPLPKGSEDVAFKQSSATVVKAHAVVLAKQSELFAEQIYPLTEGQSLPIVILDWTEATQNEEALKAFVKMLYGTGPDLALLDMEILLGIHSLSRHYHIPGLATEVIGRIESFQIPLSEIPNYITFAWRSLQDKSYGKTELRFLETRRSLAQAEAVTSSIEKTINRIPGKNRVIEAVFDLNPLKAQLLKNLPHGTDLEGLLDAYRKFLALKVIVGDTQVPQQLSPSPLVDQVWHAHIMRPSLYKAACEALMGSKGGELIHHDPDSANDSEDVKRERVRRTREVYHIIFGQEAPSDIWWFFSPGRMQIFLIDCVCKKHTLHVNPEESAWSLHKRVEDVTGVPSGTVRLVSDGRRIDLTESDKISDYDIEEGDTLEVYINQTGC